VNRSWTGGKQQEDKGGGSQSERHCGFHPKLHPEAITPTARPKSQHRVQVEGRNVLPLDLKMNACKIVITVLRERFPELERGRPREIPCLRQRAGWVRKIATPDGYLDVVLGVNPSEQQNKYL
jgi:hypothetical protein